MLEGFDLPDPPPNGKNSGCMFVLWLLFLLVIMAMMCAYVFSV